MFALVFVFGVAVQDVVLHEEERVEREREETQSAVESAAVAT